MFKLKYVLLSLGVGIVFTLLLFGLSEIGIASGLTGGLLSPGLLLAELAGFGARDLAAYYLIGTGDALLHGMMSFCLLSLVRSKLGQVSREKR